MAGCMMEPRTSGGRGGEPAQRFPVLTKHLLVADTLRLLELARRYRKLSEFRQEAYQSLSQGSQHRRQEVVSACVRHFLSVSEGIIQQTPLLLILGEEGVARPTREQLLIAHYVLSVPLLKAVALEFVWPRAQHDGNGAVGHEELGAFIQSVVRPTTTEGLSKTRQVVTNELGKLGILETRLLNPEQRISPAMYHPRRAEVDTLVALYLLAREFEQQGWLDRSEHALAACDTRRLLVLPDFAWAAVLREGAEQGLLLARWMGEHRFYLFRDHDAPAAAVLSAMRGE